MYPLFLCSIIAVGIIIERLWVFYKNRGNVPQIFPAVETMIQKEQYDEAAQIISNTKGSVNNVLVIGIKDRKKDRLEIEESMALQAGHEIFLLKNKLTPLGVIATISTMLGLLGTVTGLVKAFQSVASQEKMVSPRILAVGIWEALLTTVVGLVIAIPCWIFYHYFRANLEKISFQIEHYGGKLILLIKAGQK